MPEFYMMFAPKILFPEFWGGNALPTPASYAYDNNKMAMVCMYKMFILFNEK